MSAEIYLIAPPDAETTAFAATLTRLFAAADVSALLLPRGTRGDAEYAAFVREILFIGQEAGCAVLIDGPPRLVIALGADGVHVEGVAAAKAAVAALKPDLIVGVSGITSRHDAMSIGELDPDYIMFGPLSGAIAPETREMAGWWAQAMVIPSVPFRSEATIDSADPAGCEFFALSASLWQSDDPATMLAAIATRLGTAP